MKECLCFATVLVFTLTQAHGFSESETTLGYKAGYEWQNSDTQLLDLTLTGLAGDHFAIEALTLYDQLGDQTASGLGIRYSQPVFSERFAISAATRHFWVRDSDVSPRGQVLLGAAYQLPIDTRHVLEFGAGGYYNILDRDNLNSQSHDKASAFLSVSWRYNPAAREKIVLPEPPIEDIVVPMLVVHKVEPDYALGTIHFAFNSTLVIGSEIAATPERAQYDVDFVAYYSCSGTDSYNRWLSLRRIQKAKDMMLARGFTFNREGYMVSPKCTTVPEIRVEISEAVPEI